DGVNIASRLESIAEPGEVYISGGIYEQIKHKLVCGYESLGDRRVKNITDPVRVYRVLPDPAALNKRRWRENVLIFLLGIIRLAIAVGELLHWLHSLAEKCERLRPWCRRRRQMRWRRHRPQASKRRNRLSRRLPQRPSLSRRPRKPSPLPPPRRQRSRPLCQLH